MSPARLHRPRILTALALIANIWGCESAPASRPAEDAGPGLDAPPEADGGDKVLHVLWTIHVEGDSQGMQAGSPECLGPGYQGGGRFEGDLAGLEELAREAEGHVDTNGGHPKLHISPAGEFFETELDATYGGKVFRTFDWLALGHELGIQGHAIEYSGMPYCWPHRSDTPQGVEKKLVDAHGFAERWFNQGRKVNRGLTFTPGVKLDVGIFGDDRAATEAYLDHVGYRLGYRIAFEDWDGCIEDSPTGGASAPQYLYRADYGDGVTMYKICFQGAPTSECPVPYPRCETDVQAVARLDETLAALKADPDSSRLYYFAFATHSASFASPYDPARGEPAGTLAVLRRIDELVAAGERVEFVAPRELAARAIRGETTLGPLYFMALHIEPAIGGLTESEVLAQLYPGVRELLAHADGYGMKLTLMFGAPWGDYLRSDAQRSAELDGWLQRGHEIAAHHHAVCHRGWDGYSPLPQDQAEALRAQCWPQLPVSYAGSLDDLVAEVRKLDPFVRSGCMNEDGKWSELPGPIVYGTCSGYANFGTPGTGLKDGEATKALNEFVSVGWANGIERRWLTHAQTFTSETAAAALGVYAAADTVEVLGFIVHPSTVTEEVPALREVMDHLHARDPTGVRSLTVADAVRLGVLPEEQVVPPP
ncbi:MAG: hypothetical protein HY906_21230 [Deltaproteobacteria bacterium]|nr:hypothetical protein [Deltaproteobacteria bacterium]